MLQVTLYSVTEQWEVYYVAAKKKRQNYSCQSNTQVYQSYINATSNTLLSNRTMGAILCWCPKEESDVQLPQQCTDGTATPLQATPIQCSDISMDDNGGTYI
ncbi:uncharacterized protein [Dysidea avara]|uniref:uncharacterized protein n=1 Tax=Dysidea avara TaxID=196820 RepID=UPI003328BC3E